MKLKFIPPPDPKTEPDYRKEMKKAIAAAKAPHAPEQPLIYTIGSKGFFNLK